MFQKLAISWSILCTISIMCLSPIPKKNEVENENLSFGECVRDTKFWHLYLMNFCSVFYGYLLISQYKTYGTNYIPDDLYLTLVGSVGCICGSLRFLWSILLDYGYTYQQVYGLLVTTQFLCSNFIVYAANSQNKPLFLIIVSISIFCEGGHFVLLPSHCATVFGSNKRGVQAFSFMFSCFGFSSIFGGLLTNYILKNEYGYQTVFNLAAAMNLVALIILLSYSQQDFTKQEPKINWGWSQSTHLESQSMGSAFHSNSHLIESLKSGSNRGYSRLSQNGYS